jgi:hypothetical protein
MDRNILAARAINRLRLPDLTPGSRAISDLTEKLGLRFRGEFFNNLSTTRTSVAPKTLLAIYCSETSGCTMLALRAT